MSAAVDNKLYNTNTCNKQFSMVIIMLFVIRQVRSVIGLEYVAT